MNSPTAARARVAIVLVGSSITAISAELATKMGGYEKVIAIVRRGAVTTLPIAEDGSAYVDRMKYLGNFGARKEIRAVIDYITRLVGGEPFDCFIHHTTNAFSQVLSGHPLCRKYFFIEEGITALIGGQFGRPKKRTLKKLLWKIRSAIFYGGRIDKYRPFFDTSAPNYGGACAVSKSGFANLPHRIQLPYESLVATVEAPAQVVIFLDSQYFQGNCAPEDYITALAASLRNIVTEKCTAAIKFHPGEKDAVRKERFKQVIKSVETISDLTELPTSFTAERMIFDPRVKVIVGTSALGFYMGERGFPTYTFAPRLIDSSPKFAKVMKGLPKEFLEVCRPM